MKKKLKYGVGDLVTYRKDLLGVKGYCGIITAVFCDGDNQHYASIRWLDGSEYPELFQTIRLIAKAKDDRDKEDL